MQAIVMTEFGGPEVLHEADVALPEAAEDQVRIRVKAAGINPIDTKIRAGAMQAFSPVSLPLILGYDVAGIVDQVGARVTDLGVGDAVLGWADCGAYAEYTLLTKAARKPADVSWEVAAALPVAGETAQRVLDLLKVQAGDTLLIHGAAGSVGSMAVQLAVRRGAVVIGTASTANHEYVRALGATPVVYGEGLVDRVRALAPGGIDAVLDAAGKDALPVSIALRGGTSRIVTIADASAMSLGVLFSAGTPAARSAHVIAELAELVAAGDLQVTVSATYPLAQAAEAHRVSEAGHVRGKFVLNIG